MPRKEPPNSARRLEKLEKQRNALRLRKSGYSFSQIAEIIGCTKQRVGQLINESLQEYRDDIGQGSAELRVLELARLDEMQKVVQKRIDASKPTPLKIDLQAINLSIRIMERRAALLGLDIQEQKQLDDPNKLLSLGAAMFAAATRVLEMERQGILPRGRVIEHNEPANEPTSATVSSHQGQ